MSLREFTRSYIEAALWSSTDNTNEQGGEPLDYNYSSRDFSPELAARIQLDCKSFYDANEETWREVSSDSHAGHDFWLTRNGHGSGFWDREYPSSISRALTGAAHAFGEFDIYVGDDGKLYGS